ncbi:hypothetical protein DOTSEDRAFT_28930 [Dothistroma septosporum NZE10]|uniref:Uncharacterized protein n=1 Tax=Dothistroma septosporum (strain NZE10 / CBS 128990) TaxID=675120 RepID=M2XGU9_DOTSN|nr:hypothetical protein DOTSEDRAFT_28930 [Dothistroma septosporum NZE10]
MPTWSNSRLVNPQQSQELALMCIRRVSNIVVDIHTELVEHIANSLNLRAHLKTPPLDSRTIASRTYDTWQQRRFRQQACFLISQESLEIGIWVAMQLRFGPAVREICFLVEASGDLASANASSNVIRDPE